MNKKKIVIISSIAVAVILLIAGVSYAFYSANVKEENKTETVIKTNKLTIVYTGTEEINVEGIVPGDSFTKKFTVENTSNIPVTYNIYLEGITNEFNEDLVYTLKDKSGEVISEEILPTTNREKTYLITDIEIDASEIKEYEMTIEFKYSDKDQNKLQGKSFEATLGIDTTPVKIVKVVNDKLDLGKLSSGDTVTKTFSIKNLSKEKQNYDLKLSDVVSTYGDNLTYSLSKNGSEIISDEIMPSSDTTILESQKLTANSIDEYVMTIKFDNTTAALEYMLASENDEFSANIEIISQVNTISLNDNIVASYTYNQTTGASNYCVTGDEATCVENTCYESTDGNSCAAGTIIEYKVNNTETVRFHVMYDNGDTITMQSQKNTVYSTEWINAADYATANLDQTSCGYDSCNDEGPITILNALESKTSKWSNVKQQTYALGTTVFKTNSYTDCYTSTVECTENKYILDERNANARMLTAQEAFDLGCTSSQKSCPIWMYNYLFNSINYGGTENDKTTENGATVNGGYWLVNTSGKMKYSAVMISVAGYVQGNSSTKIFENKYGARAVVEIDKYN